MVAAALILSPLYARDESIKGIVRDQATQQPLIGANVIVEDTPLGAACRWPTHRRLAALE